MSEGVTVCRVPLQCRRVYVCVSLRRGRVMGVLTPLVMTRRSNDWLQFLPEP